VESVAEGALPSFGLLLWSLGFGTMRVPMERVLQDVSGEAAASGRYGMFFYFVSDP
jgi:hypothetical protein